MQWSEQLGVFLWGTTPLTSLLLSLCTLTDGPEVWGPFRPRRCRGGLYSVVQRPQRDQSETLGRAVIALKEELTISLPSIEMR